MTSDPGALSPKEIANASFDNKRRGYDPAAVDRHLKAAASTVTSLETQVVSLAAKVEELTAEVESAKAAAVAASKNPIELDEDALTERVGQDAARVLSEARAAAADRLVEAEKEAELILVKAEEAYAARSQEADEEANRIRLRAGEVAEQKAAEAEAAAAAIVSSAQADVELARSEVFSDRESADVEAERIVREAELARRQILGDLLRRRGAAKRQIEQLRAGRERLLASHETVRRALDEITEELAISMSEARAAAKTAGHSVSDGTIEELEAEIETARLTGLLDTGPVPVVRSPALPNSSSANRPPAEPVANETAKLNDTATLKETATLNDTADADTPAASAADADSPAEESPVEEAAAIENTAPEATAPESADTETSTDDAAPEVTEAESGDSDTSASNDLAEVVQLDKARAEVDTKSHPAKGREAGNGRSKETSAKLAAAPDTVESGTVESDSGASDSAESDTGAPDSGGLAAVVPAAVASTPAAPEVDDSVGDLFASLRSDNEQPEPANKKKSTAKKKPKKNISSTASSKTKPAATTSEAVKSTQTQNVVPLVDSSALARRLKRVLADEQSRAMSHIKNAETLPDVTELLFTASEHRSGYWNEVLDQLDDPALAGPDAASAIDDLVETIRRRIGEALTSANGDAETAVGSLRSIYREIKTQQIGATADAVSSTVLAPS